VAFSSLAEVAALARNDFKIQILSSKDFSSKGGLKGHRGTVRALSFIPGGALLASAGDDQTVRMWNLRAARPVKVVKTSGYVVSALAFSPDGRYLAWGGVRIHKGEPQPLLESEVFIWDFTEGKKVSALAGHKGAVLALAFSPDGKWLVSGSSDKTVKVWDPQSFVKSKEK
jgi:WD40 repeat protein